VAGIAVGAPLGAVVGGSVGYLNGSAGYLNALNPMQNVAGIVGKAVHKTTARMVGKVLGERAGELAGRATGLVSGAASGLVLGVVAIGWTGLDAGMRAGQRIGDSLVGPVPVRPLPAGMKTYEIGRGKQIPTPDGIIDVTSHHHFFVKYGLQILNSDASSDPALKNIADFMASDPQFKTYYEMGTWNMDSFLGNQAPGISLPPSITSASRICPASSRPPGRRVRPTTRPPTPGARATVSWPSTTSAPPAISRRTAASRSMR